MAKPRANSGVEISLFPFLSILACIIGCLTMVIVALSIIQMNKEGREPEEVERARAYLALEKEKDEDTRRITELKAVIEAVVMNREEINRKREELKQIQAMLNESIGIDALRLDLIKKLDELKKQLEVLLADHESLLAQIEDLKKQIADRKLDPDPPPVVVQPTGSGVNVRPFFAEVTAAAIHLHGKAGEEPVSIPIASLGSDENFQKVLDAVKSAPDRQLIFLIRGDGIAAYNRARAVADEKGVRNAKLPVVGQGELDLSEFNESLR